MDVLPAIDLRHGRVVRLRQGDDGRRTEYGVEPEAALAAFAAAGASWVHVVDLDAALGEPAQSAVVRRLAAAAGAAEPPLRLQLGGGLRDRAAVEAALALAAARVVLASLAVRDPALFAALAADHPGRLVPAVETRAGAPRIAGWTAAAGIGVDELAGSLRGLPCPAVLVTDVERDGTLAGPNLELATRVAVVSGLPALVSGGVARLADLIAATALPEVAGVVVGRALYEGGIDLAAALRAAAEAPR